MTGNNEVTLSIVIVNYNGKKYIDQCIESIRDFAGEQVEVIIVDNASSDGSDYYIEEKFSEVKLIKSKVNLGFAGGNNIGVKAAMGKYILLLNNDTKLKASLAQGLNIMESMPSIGVLGIKMMGAYGEYRYSCGYFLSPLKLLLFSSLYMKKGHFKDGSFNKAINKTILVDWVEGSFLLTRKKIWDTLDGLDDSYFMYVEDMDYCRRVKNIGYTVEYLPSMEYIHYGGYNQGRIEWLVKGFRLYINKHFNQKERLLANLVLNIGLMLRLILSCIRIPFDVKYKNEASSYMKALLNK